MKSRLHNGGVSRPALADWLLFFLCAALCWNGVKWTIRPDSFLILDEVNNLVRSMDVAYARLLTLFPQRLYNDRPVGFVLARLLFDVYGFDYERQVAVFLAIHFANCLLGFFLFRRFGVSRALSFAAVAVYGSLWTTAQTATYIGAVFDVLCLFFLLGSTLAFLSGRRGARLLSAGLFLLALRTKEFAIVTPLLFVMIAAYRSSETSARQIVRAAIRPAWMHLLIGAAFAIRYLSFVPRMSTVMSPDDPYRLSPDPAAILRSLSYYTADIFNAESTAFARIPFLLALVFAAVLAYGLYRRRPGIVFALAAYVLTLLPVCMMPGHREPYYVYAPQLFLILLLAALLEDLLAAVFPGARIRRIAGVGIALALMAGGLTIRRSSYFTDRIRFFVTVRQVSRTSSFDASRLLAGLPPKTRLYVNHGAQSPWLFIPGPCNYFKLVNMDRSITCVLNRPEADLRLLYGQDEGPKFFVDYQENGAFRVVSPGG